MSQQPDEEQVIRRYFLGELPEDQEADVEERLFSDNKFFEKCLLVESTLQDEYASGGLPEPVARRVEMLFRSSARQRRDFDFNTRLVTAVREGGASTRTTEGKRSSGWSWLFPRAPASLAWKWAPIVALALVIVSGAYLLLANSRLRNQLSELRLDRGRLEERNREIEEELAREKARQPGSNNSNPSPGPRDEALTEIASISLTPDFSPRGSGSELQTVTLAPGVKRLRIQFDSGQKEAFSKYRVSIKTFDGREVFGQELRPGSEGRKFTVTVRAGILSTDDYVVALEAAREGGAFVEIQNYSFRVKK